MFMKGTSQAILFIIVLALLARTAVNALNPGFDAFGVVACSSPSDWAEESAEEDESGEEDRVINGIPSCDEQSLKSVSPKTLHVFALLEHIPEIVVPPPQC